MMTHERLRRDRLARAELLIIEVIDELIKENPKRQHMQTDLVRDRDAIGRICRQLRGMIDFASQTQPGDRQESIDPSEDRTLSI